MSDAAYRASVDAAFYFQGAAAVTFMAIKRIAEKGYALEGMPVMECDKRLTMIAADCDRMLAKLPADLIEYLTKR